MEEDFCLSLSVFLRFFGLVFWWVFFVGGGYDFDFVGFFVNFWDYFCDFLTSPHAEQHSPLQQRMCIGFLSIP